MPRDSDVSIGQVQAKMAIYVLMLGILLDMYWISSTATSDPLVYEY